MNTRNDSNEMDEPLRLDFIMHLALLAVYGAYGLDEDNSVDSFI